MRWRVSLIWQPRDFWVGIYVGPRYSGGTWTRHIYILPLPMVGLRISYSREVAAFL
jgi:hypothetical protein